MDQRCIKGLDALGDDVRGCVLTIGNFDGVHLGHRRILRTARELADTENTCAVAMTFDPPPDLVIRPDDVARRISPPELKCDLLRQAGADYAITVRATRELLALSPQEFIEQIIMNHFAPKHMVEGHNFFFGAKRAGNVELLADVGKQCGFDVHIVEPYRIELDDRVQRVSSTLIRELVSLGRVDAAAKCLNRPFILYGPVIPGHGRGRLIDYPTANIDIGDQVRPGDGIYAGFAVLDDRRYPAAISVGKNPTFGGDTPTVEAFLLDTDNDLYGKHLELGFTKRLRDVEKYESVDALKRQISKDVQRVRELCG